MKNKSIGKLLRIFVGELDKWQGKPLYEGLLNKAHEMGMAGATVLRAIQGFGGGRRTMHNAKILRLSEDLPLVIEMVDSEENIRAAIEAFEKMIDESGAGVLMTLEQAEVIRYHK